MPITYTRDADSSDDDYSGDLPDSATLDPNEFDEPLSRPLKDCTQAEIFAELELRYRSFAFHGIAHKQHDDEAPCFNKIHGDFFTCVGLVVGLEKMLKDRL